MNRSSAFLRTAAWIFCGLVISGCGQTGDGYNGPRGQVTGTAKANGIAIPSGCEVLFVGLEKGYTAVGTVDSSGRYTLIYPGGNGLPAGEYQVQFSPPRAAESKTSGADIQAETQEKMKMALFAKGKPIASGNDGPFPSRYASVRTSKLQFTVLPGDNVADFNLEP